MRAVTVMLLTLLLLPATAIGAKPKRAKVLTAIAHVQKQTHFAKGRKAAKRARRAFARGKTCKAADALAAHHRLTAKRRLRALDARSVKARVLVLRSLKKGKACGGKPTVAVDTSMKAPPKLPDGTVTATTVDALGHSVDFAVGELLVHGERGKVEALAKKLGGTIKAELGLDSYLISFDPARANPDRMAADLAALGGKSRGAAAAISSQDGADTVAAAARLARAAGDVKVGLDIVGEGSAIVDGSATEDGDGPTGFADTGDAWNSNPFHWKYLTQTGVPAAWQLLAQSGRTQNKVGLAVLDMGFSPSTDPSDFGTPLEDFSVVPFHGLGDENLGDCGKSICPWHGTQVATTAFGVVDDQNGTAGVGGPVADRIVGFQYYDFGTSIVGISEADIRGADVINMSYGAPVPYYLAWSVLPFELATAIVGSHTTLVASAGNDNTNVDDTSCFIACWENTWWTPCENAGVICVGALAKDGTGKADYSNYGNKQVDIFAPGTTLSGHTPPVPPATITKPVSAVSGTSFASPYFAGAAALVRAANPGLGTGGVEDALMSTATSSSDPKVKKYVNTLAAVRKVLPRLVHIRAPQDGDVYQKGQLLTFTAFAFDPGGAAATLVWKSDGGVIGTGPAITVDLPYGSHAISVTADFPGNNDPVEGRRITIANTPPQLEITQPSDGATFFQGETVQLKSTSGDLNQPDLKLRPEQISWARDGVPFATGEDPSLDLTGVPVGPHTITARATDDAGAVTTDAVTINVATPPPNLPPSVKITNPADPSPRFRRERVLHGAGARRASVRDLEPPIRRQRPRGRRVDLHVDGADPPERVAGHHRDGRGPRGHARPRGRLQRSGHEDHADRLRRRAQPQRLGDDRLRPGLLVAQQRGGLGGQDAAVAVHERDPRVGLAQLPDRLRDQEQAVHPGVAEAEAAAVGVHRQARAARRGAPALDVRAALALRAEAEVLQEQDRRDREGVVELEHVDVVRGQAGLLEGPPARLDGGRAGQVGHRRDVAVGMCLAGAEEPHAAIARGQDRRRAAVGDQAAVADAEGVGDARRREDVLDRQRVLRPRARVALRPGTGADRYLGELLGGRPELVHVPGRRQRVGGHRVERLVGRLVGVDLLDRGVGAADEPLRGAVDDQRHLAAAGLDRGRGVVEVRDEGRPAHLRRVAVAGLDAEIGAGRQRGHVELGGGGEEAVDVAELEPGVVERAHRGLAHQVLGPHALREVLEIGLADAGDHDARNTGTPSSKATATRAPIGASVRLMRRKPSSMSMRETILGAPSRGRIVVVA